MQALVFTKLKQLKYLTVPDLTLQPGEVLLQVKACGICSSDLDRYNFSGAYHYPIILGHEIAGKIVKCAPDVKTEYLGKRAVLFPLLPCRKCPPCTRADYALCQNYDYFGSRRDGGFAQFLAVPLWNIKIFDDTIPFKTAALTEPAAVAFHALSKVPVSAKNLLIIGTGTIGILVALWAQRRGLQPFLACRNEHKIKYIRSLGLSCLEPGVNTPFDAVVECVGNNETIQTAVKYVNPKGTVVLVGNPKQDIALPRSVYWRILRQEINLTGVWNSVYPTDWDFVLTHLKDIPAEKLITHTFRLEEGTKAFETLSEAKNFKIKGMFISEEDDA